MLPAYSSSVQEPPNLKKPSGQARPLEVGGATMPPPKHRLKIPPPKQQNKSTHIHWIFSLPTQPPLCHWRSIEPTFSIIEHRHKPTHQTTSMLTQPSFHRQRCTKLTLSTTANRHKRTFILTRPRSAKHNLLSTIRDLQKFTLSTIVNRQHLDLERSTFIDRQDTISQNNQRDHTKTQSKLEETAKITTKLLLEHCCQQYCQTWEVKTKTQKFKGVDHQ